MVNRWRQIEKDIKKLGVIPDYINTPLNLSNTWNVFVSDRSNGKTTSWLLFGLRAYVRYGIVLHYVRSNRAMITEGALNTIYNTIVSCGYISKITDGNWESIAYYRNKHAFYLCNRDDSGKIINVDATPCTVCMSIDKSDDYKSGYQCDTGDLILFDEFINTYYRRGEFVKFCDLISTIIRKRMDCKIVMLANTILRTSEYFDELECREFIDNAEGGDSIDYNVENESGGLTSVHVEILSPKIDDKRKLFNSKYFSFHNPLLYSITGSGWAIRNYKHMESDFTVIYNNIFLEYKQKFYSMKVVQLECGRYTVFITPHTHEPKKDAYIYSDSHNPFDLRYHSLSHGLNDFDNWVLERYYSNDIIYSNNTCGSIFHDFIQNYR